MSEMFVVIIFISLNWEQALLTSGIEAFGCYDYCDMKLGRGN